MKMIDFLKKLFKCKEKQQPIPILPIPEEHKIELKDKPNIQDECNSSYIKYDVSASTNHSYDNITYTKVKENKNKKKRGRPSKNK